MKTTVRPILNRGQKISDHGFLEQVDRDNQFAVENLGLARLSAYTITSQNRSTPPRPPATLPHRLPPLSTIVTWSASAQERPALRAIWLRCRKGPEKGQTRSLLPCSVLSMHPYLHLWSIS
uniref:Uncharacterized protein n=1 Tax=Arundo donax TaxID=35708 RepID=A0A0A9DQV2_ARUDO